MRVCVCVTTYIFRRARPVYVYGQLVYSVGMVFMAALRHPTAVIIFSCCAGVMYSTLCTMPYLLVAHYHESGMVSTVCECVCSLSLQSVGQRIDCIILLFLPHLLACISVTDKWLAFYCNRR